MAEYNKIAVKSQKGMEGNEVPIIWGAAVVQFKNTLPVVVALRNKALKDRHWAMITEMIGQELNLEADDFTLGALLEMGVDKHMEAILILYYIILYYITLYYIIVCSFHYY